MRMQRGFSLVVVLIVTTLVAGMTIAYLYRSSLGVRVSGSMRDASMAQQLAVAGVDRMMGQLTSLDTACVAGSPAIPATPATKNSPAVPATPAVPAQRCQADVNGNYTPDMDELAVVDLTTAPTALPLAYAYYPKSGNATPIVQRVASGEGAGMGFAKLNSQQVNSAVNALRIEDLFVSGSVRPVLLSENAAGGVTRSVNTWESEPSTEKVAVWVEIEPNPANAAAIDVYCASAAQYGKARSYLRQFVGTLQ